ncbi:hypothetical protein HDU76_005081, partial [Blyttiomyces sp. JEL0837]
MDSTTATSTATTAAAIPNTPISNNNNNNNNNFLSTLQSDSAAVVQSSLSGGETHNSIQSDPNSEPPQLHTEGDAPVYENSYNYNNVGNEKSDYVEGIIGGDYALGESEFIDDGDQQYQYGEQDQDEELEKQQAQQQQQRQGQNQRDIENETSPFSDLSFGSAMEANADSSLMADVVSHRPAQIRFRMDDTEMSLADGVGVGQLGSGDEFGQEEGQVMGLNEDDDDDDGDDEGDDEDGSKGQESVDRGSSSTSNMGQQQQPTINISTTTFQSPRISLHRVARIRLGPGALAEPDDKSEEDTGDEVDDDDDDDDVDRDMDVDSLDSDSSADEKMEDVVPSSSSSQQPRVTRNRAAMGGFGQNTEAPAVTVEGRRGITSPRAAGAGGTRGAEGEEGGVSRRQTRSSRPTLLDAHGHPPHLAHPSHPHVPEPPPPASTAVTNGPILAILSSVEEPVAPTSTSRRSERTQPGRAVRGRNQETAPQEQVVTFAAAFVKGNQRPYNPARMAANIPDMVRPMPRTPAEIMKIFNKTDTNDDLHSRIPTIRLASIPVVDNSTTTTSTITTSSRARSTTPATATKALSPSPTSAVPRASSTPAAATSAAHSTSGPEGISSSAPVATTSTAMDFSETTTSASANGALILKTESDTVKMEASRSSSSSASTITPIPPVSQNTTTDSASATHTTSSSSSLAPRPGSATTPVAPSSTTPKEQQQQPPYAPPLFADPCKTITPPWTTAELDALDRGLESVGKKFSRISREYVVTRSTSECIEAYYAKKFILRSYRIKNYRKTAQREDDDYA